MAEVALVGVGGYGGWHLRNVDRLRRAGKATLTAVCDPTPAAGRVRAELDSVPVYRHLDELFAHHRPGVTVIASPIPTHAEFAAMALRAGSDVLLEKPPVTSHDELIALRTLADSVGRSVQVGFQSLGSHAVPALIELIDSGALGTVTGVGGAGIWVRSFDYYRRAPWAGRRTLDGDAVVDGTLTNPFAHAVATAFAVAHPEALTERPSRVAVELYRAYDIEADDTACLRASFGQSAPVVVAATLCGQRDHDPFVVVHGDAGRAVLHYEQDMLTVHTRHSERWHRKFGRTDLLENLLEHRVDRRRTPLLVPLRASTAFVWVADTIRQTDHVRPLHPRFWQDDGGRRMIDGVDAVVQQAAEELKMFSELGIEWANREVL